MSRPAKRKEKWTLSFNPALKSAVVKAAKRRGSRSCDRARKSREGKGSTRTDIRTWMTAPPT